MKELFLYLRAKLMALSSINWVDLDKGQLNNYDTRPAIDFPAVLLKIEYPNTTKLSRKEQQCNVLVTASIVYDCMDDTDSITGNDLLAQSLKVYDIAQEVHEALQGECDNTIIRAPLDRLSFRDPNRNDQLKVLQYTYSTKIIA
ncbi:MAG TPA: hypothetical protein PKA53_03745 [Sphingobacterium sp.]|nr:hypothetical protein [Sphingobacterium sp.]